LQSIVGQRTRPARHSNGHGAGICRCFVSTDDSVACGTCHRPAAGGADPRSGHHPGAQPGTDDGGAGSLGIRRLDAGGRPGIYPVFGDERITAVRIALAIANCERTLVADNTPWDRTDPRIAAERFPFDRPRLASEP
jgi:hypothetical protein